MKKTTLVALATVVGGSAVSVAHLVKTYNDKCKSMGYVYNKEKKQWEKPYQYTDIGGAISGIVDTSCDKLSLQFELEAEAEKTMKRFFIVSFIVGLICGIINKHNK